MILTSQLLLVVGFLNAQKNQPTQIQAEVSRKKEKADALEALGWKLAEQKNDSCLAVLKESIELSVSANYPMGIANANIALGVFYRNQDNFVQAQNHFFKALSIYEKENDRSKMAICYNNIGNLYSSSANFSKALFYYEKAMEIYFQLKQYLQYSQTCNNIGSIFLHEENNYKSALKYYDKGLKYSDVTLDPENYSILLLGKGGALFMLDQIDSAKYYYNQALFYYKKNNLTKGLCAAYFDIGYAYEMNGSLKESLHYYHQSLQLAKKSDLYSFMQKPLEGLMLVHNQLMNEDSVEHYYYELAEINALLFKEKTAKNIHDVETKYQTEKKEQALSLEKERREKSEQINQANRQTITFLSVAVALALVLILGVWGFQNQKQQIIQLKLRQQNDEIERLIHDQQVKSYESQLEGEAQERKRIASELHDRVGGLLATLNLHFEVLTERKSLLEDGLQIQQLIKASIDEVRTISHNLHGIGQSKGLFNSLEQLKNGISSSGKLEMNLFYEIGDVSVPENVSSELYKIVQELSTNTLKHAKAKKITVQLSVIENMLHLIYEDNGSGFDVATSKKGLGIINVAERVDRCNGTWHIDSSIGRGTTVIINIPLE